MEIKAIGNQLCQYGTSTFYKGIAFKIPANKKPNSVDVQNANGSGIESQKTFVIGIGDCVPVRPFDSDSFIECLAEIRMIWRDKVEQTFLLSLRLFFLPENTPKGRNGHGEDEVVAVKDAESPKSRIVIRAEDFSTWLVNDRWNWGLMASYHEKPSTKMMKPSNGIPITSLLSNTKIDLSDVEKEKEGNVLHSNVTVLSYSRYCRYRATLKRLENVENDELRNKLIETLSGFVASQPNTRIMFVKETFECPDLESLDSLCPYLAPKLKGKPLKGRRKQIASRVSECSSPAPSSESCESNDSDVFDGKHLMRNNDFLKANHRLTRNKGKSESNQTEVYTTLSGRVAKQRLPLSPLKSASGNKRKRKADASDESSTDDDQRDDEDYEEKYVNRKIKIESGLKRQNSTKEEIDQGVQMLHLLKMPFDTSKSSEELDFLVRLNTFMAERSSTYSKFAWELRDVNLFTIYTRVQKLGGFNAIADDRVWKNLFECDTQGMTKRRYERILLPFEIYERELRENGKHSRSELTISTIPKNSIRRDVQTMASKRRPSASPAIEIIPLKNGAAKNLELSIEQTEYNSSNDGVSVPVHVIVRPQPNERKMMENERMAGSSRSSLGGGQKENIPLSTTIVPLTRDGVPTGIVDLVDSDDDEGRNSSCHSNMKKRKLDILREGGLEVTPISRRAQNDMQFSTLSSSSKQPNVSLMSLAPVRAPPVIQSFNMYQSTRQVFKNPKEDVFSATKNLKSICLDLTSKKQQDQQYRPNQRPSSNSMMSIEEVQRNYRGSNPDLQITLVKPPTEIPSSSSSRNNTNNHKNRQQQPYKTKTKSVSSSSSTPHLPPLNPIMMAAANELQKLQQQNMPSFFPFLSGLDITPQQSSSKSTSQQINYDQSQASLMSSYLQAFYANPLLQGQNILPPAVEFLKLFNNPTSSNRVPSSKN